MGLWGLVVCQNKGNPIENPKYSTPYYRTPKMVPLILANPPLVFLVDFRFWVFVLGFWDVWDLEVHTHSAHGSGCSDVNS